MFACVSCVCGTVRPPFDFYTYVPTVRIKLGPTVPTLSSRCLPSSK